MKSRKSYKFKKLTEREKRIRLLKAEAWEEDRDKVMEEGMDWAMVVIQDGGLSKWNTTKRQ